MSANVATGPGGTWRARSMISAARSIDSRERTVTGKPLPQSISPLRASDRRAMSLLLRGGYVVTQNPRREVVRGDVLVEKGRSAALGDVRGSAGLVIGA